jgi:hypothetical protein
VTLSFSSGTGVLSTSSGSSVQLPFPTRTYWVSPVGTAAQNGQRLRDVLAAIPSPSATSPALVRIEPGVYDIGTSQLAMRPFVDIEGSGPGVTRITNSVAGGGVSVGVVRLVSNAELRDLTVENRNTSGLQSTGLAAGGTFTEAVRARKVVVSIPGPITVVFATYFEHVATVDLDGVTLDARGGSGGTANQAFRIDGGVGTVRNSTINAGAGGCALMYPGTGQVTSFRLSNTQLVGSNCGTNTRCAGVFNDVYTTLTNLCQ